MVKTILGLSCTKIISYHINDYNHAIKTLFNHFFISSSASLLLPSPQQYPLAKRIQAPQFSGHSWSRIWHFQDSPEIDIYLISILILIWILILKKKEVDYIFGILLIWICKWLQREKEADWIFCNRPGSLIIHIG